MSWFEKAKTVLIEALDIQDDDSKTAEANSSNAIAATTMKTISPSVENESKLLGSACAPTFFDNPNANEMVTIPPRASDSAATVASHSPASVAPAEAKLNTKRQSATSDSVDLLSSPSAISPSVDECLQNSESSLELITATTASEFEMSPDTEPSLPDSIVIIASNETSDNPEGDAEADDDIDDQQVVLLEQEEHSLHLNDSTKTMKALQFNDMKAATTIAGADSDSTQSFEDVQLQLSNKSVKRSGSELHTDTQTKGEIVDQSYSSTSSDIEIISNPNGDSSTNSTTARTSPQKLKELNAKTSAQGPMKSKGHYREPSEISLLSEDSQSELDKLVNRISELNQVIEAREQRLLQSERQNAELLERNQELRAAVEAVNNSVSNTDANNIDAVQRLSALEKKFQSSIRERDALRIQIRSLKDELLNKIPKDELAECNEMIAALQSEGEKLSKEILQQSNIIKRLRAKEKTTDTLLKKNGEQISQLSSESERLKKSLAAKEEMERTQIEAVCKMANEKRRVEDENAECRSRIEDLQSKLAALQTSFDGIKGDLQKRTRLEQDQIKAENQEYVQQLHDMREKLRLSEQNIVKREQQLREENRELLRRVEAAELRAESSTQELSITTTPLIRQIELLQKSLNQRTTTWNKEESQLLQKLEEAQLQLNSLQDLQAAHEEKHEMLRARCKMLEDQLSTALMQMESARITLRQQQLDADLIQNDYKMQVSALQEDLKTRSKNIDQLTEHCTQLETELHKQWPSFATSELTVEAVKAATKRNELQGQKVQTSRASPPISLAADSYTNEEPLGGIIDCPTDVDMDCVSNSGRQPSGLIQGVQLNILAPNTTTLEHLQSLLKQRDGELTHLQWEQSRQQAERDVLDVQISNLTIELETLKEKLESYENMEKSYEDLQHRYDALLQMYGEKVERTEELELDLFELKQAYKLQIDELLANPPPKAT